MDRRIGFLAIAAIALMLAMPICIASKDTSLLVDVYLPREGSNAHMEVFASFGDKITLANRTDGTGTTVIYKPDANNPLDLQTDASNQIIMCAGTLDATLAPVGIFDNAGSTSPYPPPWERAEPTNPPWGSDMRGMPVQWQTTDPSIITTMRGRGYTRRVVNPADWPRIQTEGQNINVVYYPVTDPNVNYTNKPSEIALICRGTQKITINGAGAYTSNIDGHPATQSTTALPRFSTAGTTYSVQNKITVDECVGATKGFPDQDNYDTKYHFVDTFGFYPWISRDSNPSEYKIKVVDPKTCNVFATVNPKSIVPADGATYPLKITIDNSQNLYFGMIADDVGIQSSPEPGWSVAKATAPNGFDPEVIPAAGSKDLSVVLSAPTPVTVRAGCVDINVSLHSEKPLCDLSICRTQAVVQVCFDTDYRCVLTTNTGTTPPNKMQPGEDLTITAACYNGTTEIDCPRLDWRHTFDSTVAIDNNQAQKRCNPKPSSINTAPEPPAPTTYLFTWDRNSACPTNSPQSGDVVVAGRIAGQDFSCNVSDNYNDLNITIVPNCSILCNLSYNNSAEATTPLYVGFSPVIRADCNDTILNSKNCTNLTWASDAGSMSPPVTYGRQSPMFSTLSVSNVAGTQVNASYLDAWGNLCFCNLSLNASKPNLKVSFSISPNPTPLKKYAKINATVYNADVGDCRVASGTMAQINYSGSSTLYNIPKLFGIGGNPNSYTIQLPDFYCDRAGFYQVSAYADKTYIEDESNELDNYGVGIINCGQILACYDYV